MTAPAPTARIKPSDVSGILGNGFASMITFEADPDVLFLEIEVTEGGVEGGDGIDDTTMFNTARMTQNAPALYKRQPGQAVVAYAAASEGECLALINLPGTITITYPDGATKADFGWLKSFVPGALTINGRPTATVAFDFTGKDPATGDEEDAVDTPFVPPGP